MTAKTLLIGLDGAEPELLKKWAERGLLPRLSALMKDYYTADMQTPPGFGDGVFWASLITGANAGKHGHFFPKQFNSLNYQLYDYSLDQDFGREPFLFFCSAMGHRVGVVDIYTSPLVSGLNGIQVMDWMIHDRTGEPRSWPSPLIDHLHDHYMEDPLGGNTETLGRTPEEDQQLQQGMIDRIDAKKRATVELLSKNEWDLFCVGFCDAHDVGHQSWNFDDDGEEGGAEVLEVYQAMDVALGEIIDSANADNIYIVAGLGMEKQSPYNTVLQLALGHYSGITGSRKEITDRRIEMPYFELPHNMHAGAVRINLQGRESQGKVDKDQYQLVLDEVADRLARLSCAETGVSIVKSVVKINEHYHGPRLDQLPDLFVVWEKGTNATSVRVDAETVFPVVPVFEPEMRSGDHSDRAWFMSNRHYADSDVVTEAVAPTICRTLGVNLPDVDALSLVPLD